MGRSPYQMNAMTATLNEMNMDSSAITLIGLDLYRLWMEPWTSTFIDMYSSDEASLLSHAFL